MPGIVFDPRGDDFAKKPLDYPGHHRAQTLMMTPSGLIGMRISPDADYNDAVVDEGIRPTRLPDFLAANRADPLDRRMPVLGFGEDLALPTVYRTLLRAGVTPLVPIFRCRVQGVALGHLGRFDNRGVCPAAIYRSGMSSVPMALMLLDADQVTALTRAKRHDYRMVPIWPRMSTVAASINRRLVPAFLFRSKPGVLVDPITSRPIRFDTQDRLHAQIARFIPEWARTWNAVGTRQMMRDITSSAPRRKAFDQMLATYEMVGPDRFG